MTVNMPPLEQWQKDLFNIYNANDHGKIIVVKSIRLVGKSVCLCLLLIYASLKEAGSTSKVISPVFSQSKKLYDDIYRIATPLISRANGAEYKITFINGSTISFNSAELGDNLRGFTVKKSGILAVDEAAFVDEDFFYSVLLPMTNVYKSDIFMFSTPKFKQGAFYDLYTDGINGKDNIIAVDWTTYDTTKYLSEETLNIYRLQLPKSAFESEYLGQWISGDGAVFSDFKSCITPALKDTHERLIIGVDWATGNGGDDTVLTAGQFVNNKILVQDIKYFNDKQANETVEYIIEYMKSKINEGYKEIHVVVEKNSIGNVFGDILRQQIGELDDLYNQRNMMSQISLSFLFFTTTNQSKEKIIKQLCVLFENNKISIPNNAKLINELSMYEVKVSSAGNCIYNAPNRTGCHDDMVMSMAIMANTLYNETI